MKLKNFLTGILLAGSVALYGQKTISETYGTKGERIVYKDYSKISWEQVDSNKINIKNLENMLAKPEIANKKTFKDTVFAEAEKLGYTKKEIKNLKAEEAVNLTGYIVVNRYEYDHTEAYKILNDKDSLLHSLHSNNDFYFFRKLGVCNDYSWSFIEVFDLIKKENKNLNNIYAKRKEGLMEYENHAWNQLLFLTKDSLFILDIDITNYDNGGKLEAIKNIYFDFETEAKIDAIDKSNEYALNYNLNKELLNQIPDLTELERKINNNNNLTDLIKNYKKTEDESWNILLKTNETLVTRNLQATDSLFAIYDGFKNFQNSLKKDIKDKITILKKEKALRNMISASISSKNLSFLQDIQKKISNDNKYWFEDMRIYNERYEINRKNKNKKEARRIKKEFKKKYPKYIHLF